MKNGGVRQPPGVHKVRDSVADGVAYARIYVLCGQFEQYRLHNPPTLL